MSGPRKGAFWACICFGLVWALAGDGAASSAFAAAAFVLSGTTPERGK